MKNMFWIRYNKIPLTIIIHLNIEFQPNIKCLKNKNKIKFLYFLFFGFNINY